MTKSIKSITNVVCNDGKVRSIGLDDHQVATLLRGERVTVSGDYLWLTNENFSMIVLDLSTTHTTHLESYTLNLFEYHIGNAPGKPIEITVSFGIINQWVKPLP